MHIHLFVVDHGFSRDEGARGYFWVFADLIFFSVEVIIGCAVPRSLQDKANARSFPANQRFLSNGTWASRAPHGSPPPSIQL